MRLLVISQIQQWKKAQTLNVPLELRLDLYTPPKEPSKIFKRCLLTLRSKEQGGEFSGSQEERYTLLEGYLEQGAHAVDIEYPQDIQLNQWIQKKYPYVHRLISYHNWEKTPPDLNALLCAMQGMEGHSYKVACRCQTSTDALRLWQWARLINSTKKDSLLTTLGIGDFGAITRFAAPLAACPWTYAVPDDSPGKISGVPEYSAFDRMRPWEQLSTHTQLLGLIGQPVTHSISHLTHNAYLREQEIDALYLKIPINTCELPQFFKELRRGGWRGLSVTMPLKEAVIPYLDSLDPLAARIGAVNTIIVKEDGSLHGANTDAIAALELLKESRPLSACRVCLVGAGGAAKAIAHALSMEGAQLTVFNRTFARAEALAQEVQGEAFPLEDLKRGGEWDILIQASSMGMAPRIDENPVPPAILHPKLLVMDIVGKPRRTRLIQEADRAGCPSIDGRAFFARQAAAQFALWYTEQVNRQTMSVLCQTVS